MEATYTVYKTDYCVGTRKERKYINYSFKHFFILHKSIQEGGVLALIEETQLQYGNALEKSMEISSFPEEGKLYL